MRPSFFNDLRINIEIFFGSYCSYSIMIDQSHKLFVFRENEEAIDSFALIEFDRIELLVADDESC